MGQNLELVVLNGAMAGNRFAIPQSGLRLGRSSANDVSIKDEELSRNHCMFELLPDGAVQLIDLASANGTFVNGTMVESEPKRLSPDDEISAGSTRFKIVEKGSAVELEKTQPIAVPQAASVASAGNVMIDLGLGLGAEGESENAAKAQTPEESKRASLVNVIWAGVVVVFALAIGVILCVPSSGSGKKSAKRSRVAVEEPARKLHSLYYEKVEADAGRIFRFVMTIDGNGALRVVHEDVPAEDRHVDKSAVLAEESVADIVKLFSSPAWEEGDDSYLGASAESENALKRWRIRTVIGEKVRETLVENSVEPAYFREAREALEAFAISELHISPLHRSKEELTKLAEESSKIGDERMEEAEVEFGNVAAALKAYNEAVFYLDTVNPKPAFYADLKEKQRKANIELDRRFEEQRFAADKAINMGDWEAAQRQLSVLIDIINDRNDDRSIKARAELVNVEERMKKKGGKKK